MTLDWETNLKFIINVWGYLSLVGLVIFSIDYFLGLLKVDEEDSADIFVYKIFDKDEEDYVSVEIPTEEEALSVLIKINERYGTTDRFEIHYVYYTTIQVLEDDQIRNLPPSNWQV